MEKYTEFEYYWTDNRTIIFKPYFDCELDEYHYKILEKCEEIFFASYDNLSKILKKKHDNNYPRFGSYTYSKFNKKIELHERLKSVTFGDNFNQKIELPLGLKTVTFGDNFNQEVKLPEGLKNVKFGNNFNQEIKLFERLKNIKFGYYFNKEIKLPSKLESVIFGHNFNKKIKLPKELKMISMRENFKLNLLPNNLEEININCFFGVGKNINYVTNKIKKIYISLSKRILKNLPNSVKFIVFENKRRNTLLDKYTSRIKTNTEY